MSRFRDRPTPDLIVMFLAAIVGVLMIGAMLSVIYLEAVHAAVDLDKLSARLADVTNTLIGAIVGYLAGRGAGTPPKPPHPPEE
jgi:hypothetical protein